MESNSNETSSPYLSNISDDDIYYILAGRTMQALFYEEEKSMAKVHMQSNVDISKFRKRLKDAIEHNTPVDDLCELVKDLVLFEQKYGIKSQVFYDKFMRGEMGDARDFIQWAGKYEMFLKLYDATMDYTVIASPDNYDHPS